MAVGLGANVTILDLNAKRLAYLDDIFGGRVQTLPVQLLQHRPGCP